MKSLIRLNVIDKSINLLLEIYQSNLHIKRDKLNTKALLVKILTKTLIMFYKYLTLKIYIYINKKKKLLYIQQLSIMF